MVRITKIYIKYSGTLIKYTKKLNEEIQNSNLTTMQDFLNHLAIKYGDSIIEDMKKNFKIILYRDGDKGVIINEDKLSEIKLGQDNKIQFFYPLMGG